MKSKSNFRYIYEIYKNSINTSNFLLIFIFSIILAIYSVLTFAFKDGYITGFLNVLFSGFPILIILLLVLANSINTYKIFEQNQFYIIRFSTKNKYLNELVKNVCFSNFCLLILNVILIMICLNIFNITYPNIKIYQFQSPVYLIYIIIRLIVISQLLSIINIYLFKLINNKLIIGLNIILYALIIIFPYSRQMVDSLFNIPLFIGNYLTHTMYSSFLFEVCCFLLYCGLLILLISFLNKITLKYMEKVIQ